jgi:hypothetical protein
MAKSSQSYTNFKTNELRRGEMNLDRHIEYCERYPEALNWKIGLIHSHNSMSTFFSGTDLEEIYENSKAHNYYLSIITNNKNELIGKIAIQTKIINNVKVEYRGIDEEGYEYIVKEDKIDKNTSEVFYLDVKCIAEEEEEPFDFFFENNLEDIIKSSKRNKHNFFRQIDEEEYSRYFMNRNNMDEEDFIDDYNDYNDDYGYDNYSILKKTNVKEDKNRKFESFLKFFIKKYLYITNIKFITFASLKKVKEFLITNDIKNYDITHLAQAMNESFIIYFGKHNSGKEDMINEVIKFAENLKITNFHEKITDLKNKIFNHKS